VARLNKREEGAGKICNLQQISYHVSEMVQNRTKVTTKEDVIVILVKADNSTLHIKSALPAISHSSQKQPRQSQVNLTGNNVESHAITAIVQLSKT